MRGRPAWLSLLKENRLASDGHSCLQCEHSTWRRAGETVTPLSLSSTTGDDLETAVDRKGWGFRLATWVSRPGLTTTYQPHNHETDVMTPSSQGYSDLTQMENPAWHIPFKGHFPTHWLKHKIPRDWTRESEWGRARSYHTPHAIPLCPAMALQTKSSGRPDSIRNSSSDRQR